MRVLCKFFIVASVTAAFVTAQAAQAEVSEWMSGEVVFKYARKLGAQGLIVTKMECKDSGSRELGVESALVRLHYSQNTKHLDWQIDGWNNLEENKKYWAEKGYSLASYTTFIREKSRLKLFCTVYNR
ncbi:hypothetical protein J2858_000713 [Neorhizobium galegae]|uniref:hypothetical protein n=1 Tax=Neorhizobium galegae TaxID=399 RepID=UPI001FDAB675|nr:hypothetical protein [Neorhizobium galegae]MBP2547820.1 hypothetical protein [Neorhizobium galegae]